jgi:hypothetical protein
MLASGTFGGLVVSMLACGNFGGLVVSMLACGNFGGLAVGFFGRNISSNGAHGMWKESKSTVRKLTVCNVLLNVRMSFGPLVSLLLSENGTMT